MLQICKVLAKDDLMVKKIEAVVKFKKDIPKGSRAVLQRELGRLSKRALKLSKRLTVKGD